MTKAIKICLWLLAFIPLIVLNSTFFPYVTGKNLFIESLLVMVSILFVIHLFYSPQFRTEITEKIQVYIKNPLIISVLAFLFVFIISTIFAVDKYSAFWGDLSRAEGLAGTMFFFSFFVYSLLIFEKEDWLWFFKLSLLATAILLLKEFYQAFSGIIRPDSFTGNTTYLAGYLLFSITSAIIVFSNQGESLDREKGLSLVSKNNKKYLYNFWQYFSAIIIILSIIGIFLTQTRGSILGLGLGVFVTIIYCAIKGKNINYKKFNLRKIAITILCVGILFSGLFVITRDSSVWQKVPGLSRVAVTGTGGTEDLSTNIRLIVYKTGLEAVNPVKNGWGKTLVGWGPDNFILAYAKYYNPELYKYQQDWSDRSHNKFIDVLVMTGLLGLLAYLSVLFFYFRFSLKSYFIHSDDKNIVLNSHYDLNKKFSLINIALIFWGVSYLTHLMVVFDVITTSIPFFASLSFVAFLSANVPIIHKNHNLEVIKEKRKVENVSISIFISIAILLCFIFIKETIPSYYEQQKSFYLIDNYNISSVSSEIDSLIKIPTTAERYILKGLFTVVIDNYNKNPNEQNLKLLDNVLSKGEDYTNRRPLDFVFIASLADAFSKDGNTLKNSEYLSKGEKYYKMSLNFAPNRQDLNYGLALDLVFQKKYAESLYYFEKSLVSDSGLYKKDRKTVEEIYTTFIVYFYNNKNKDNFIITANRLKVNNYPGSEVLDQIINYLNTKGAWPIVNFD